MDVEALIGNPDIVERVREWYGQEQVNLLYFFQAIERRAGYDELIANFGPGAAYAVDWSRLGLDQELTDIRWYLDDPDDPYFYVLEDLSRTPHTAESAERYIVPRVNIANGAWGRVATAVGNEVYANIAVYETYLNSERSEGNAGAATVDWGAVQEVNKLTLKGLEEGESVPFWQAGSFLVLGSSGDPHARMAIEQQLGLEPTGSSPNGTVTMVEKGGMMSPGSIRVQGAYQAAELEQAIREFSKKEIDFA